MLKIINQYDIDNYTLKEAYVGKSIVIKDLDLEQKVELHQF